MALRRVYSPRELSNTGSKIGTKVGAPFASAIGPVPAYLLLAGIAIFPLYFFPSGGVQLSHGLLFLACLLFVIVGASYKSVNINLAAAAILIVYSFFIGLFWFLVHLDTRAVLGPTYLLFNIIVLFAAAGLFHRHTEFFSRFLPLVIFLGMILQLIFYAAGVGFYGTIRFLGTFNDPNQLAYWIVCSLGVVTIIYWNKPRFIMRITPFVLLAAIILLLSKSRSGLLGVAPILLFITLVGIARLVTQMRISSLVLIFAFMTAFSIFFGLLFVGAISLENIQFWISNEFSAFVSRLVETDFHEQLGQRGYDLIALYPEYLLTGAGYGGFERFSNARGGLGTNTEIHSTFVGFLFYHGVIGSALAVWMLWRPLICSNWAARFALLGAAVYGLGTFGARNTSVWILLAVVASFGHREHAR